MKIKKLTIILIIVGSTTSLFSQEANFEAKELNRIFYSQALLASWACRIDRLKNSPEVEKNSQFIRLTELAFRYWFYSSKGIIEPDSRFEKLIYNDFMINKQIPETYLDNPIRGEIQSVPGFRWTPQEYNAIRTAFKKFIFDLAPGADTILR